MEADKAPLQLLKILIMHRKTHNMLYTGQLNRKNIPTHTNISSP